MGAVGWTRLLVCESVLAGERKYDLLLGTKQQDVVHEVIQVGVSLT